MKWLSQTLVLAATILFSGTPVSAIVPGFIDLRGTIDGLTPATQSFSVLGQVITVDPATLIFDQIQTPIGLTDLALGEAVHVQGTPRPDGGVAALEIDLEVGPEIEDIALRGAIETRDAGSFTIAGMTILADIDTVVSGRAGETTLSNLRAGMMVEVSGQTQVDGTFLADTIKIETANDRKSVDITGPVEAIADGFVVENGRTVIVGRNTVVLGKKGKKGRRLSFAELGLGNTVHIEALKRADGVLAAKKLTALGFIGAQGKRARGRLTAKSADSVTVGFRQFRLLPGVRFEDGRGRKVSLGKLKLGSRVDVEFVVVGPFLVARAIRGR